MDSVVKAKRTLDIVEALSDVLNTGLSKNELSILIALIESGCNPEVRVIVIFCLISSSERCIR